MDNTQIFLMCLGFVAAPFLIWGIAALIRNFVLKNVSEEAVLRKKDTVTQETFGGKQKKRLALYFETENKKLRFFVTQEQYAVARAGKRGVLTHKGSRFISFE